MFKILIKELITLNHIDKFLFNLAPYLVIVASMLAFGCLPFGRGLQVIDFNIGVFFLIAVSSIGVLGILLPVGPVTINLHLSVLFEAVLKW